MEIATAVIAGLALVAAVVAALGAWRSPRAAEAAAAERGATTERRLLDALQRTQTALDAALRDSAQTGAAAQRDLILELAARFDSIRDAQARALAALQEAVDARLTAMRRDTDSHLERIRATVDEKLQATLETRLGASFKLVSERLELVHKGLGEMQALATGVGDLKRVLTNVRTRGTFGETQLGALLEQVLAPAQFAKNVATVPGSSERVEFAVRLPGAAGGGETETVYLPIDAKFPVEDYLRLNEAYEAGDMAAVDHARRELRVRLVQEAKKIREKYVAPPHTTDFALLFLPTEGLYAEALSTPGLLEQIQRDHHIVFVGPTTLYAILNSLQMGFRSVAIERRSSEVWRILGAVKTEFAKFGDALTQVSKKLQEASNKIDESARRSRAVEKSLRDVETLPEGEAVHLIVADEGAVPPHAPLAGT